MRYDCIIIGAGPAGISAAITLKIRNKSVLVVGNREVSEKVAKAHEIQNYLGLPSVKGQDLAERFLNHAKSLGVEIRQTQIHTAYAMGDYYSVQTTENKILEAKTIVVATGVNFGKPYPGEQEYLGRGVSYCATCDAALYKNKKVVIIGATFEQEAEADFMSELCCEVIYIPTYKEKPRVSDKVSVVRELPLEIKGQMKAEVLVTQGGEIEADGFFILRDAVSPAQLVPGLLMDENHIAVNRKMETNLPGCFACGDIVGVPYQYMKAAGEGNIAAISVVEYMNRNKK